MCDGALECVVVLVFISGTSSLISLFGFQRVTGEFDKLGYIVFRNHETRMF